MKLNLGCGNDYKEGWVNVDYNKECKCDMVYDISKLPLPFKDNTFEKVILIHVLEHFSNPLDLIKELYRISKDNAQIMIKVPHWSCHFAYGDLTHKSFYSSRSFKHFNCKGDYYNQDVYFDVKTKLNCINDKGLLGRKIYGSVINFIINISHSFTENFLCKIIPIYENIYLLTVNKDFSRMINKLKREDTIEEFIRI